MAKRHPNCYSEYMQTGRPRQPEYAYEMKSWKTYCVKIDKADIEDVQQIISDYQGKIEEITDCDDALILYYLADHDIFIDSLESY